MDDDEEKRFSGRIESKEQLVNGCDIGGADYEEDVTTKRLSFREVQAFKEKKAQEEPGKASTFVDAAAMKERVRQNLIKPKHTVTDYYYDTGVWQFIATSQVFDKITLAVIAFNAVWIAIDTDLNDAPLLLQADPVFIVAENIFCAFFSFEWFTRFMSFRRKRDGLRDGWFCFDTIMVSMMVLETWIFTLVLLLFLDGSSGGGGNTGIMRLARLLRLSRMARMGKLLRVMPELMIMLKGMKAATRSVFFTLLLLGVITYVFGIAFAQLADGTEVGPKFFSSVPHAMYVLLMHGIFLDNMAVLANPLQDEQFLLFLFFVFVLVGALTVMNMLVGVLCEVVSAVAATEQEEMLVNYVHEKMQRVMAILDSDGGGTISKQEFAQILDNVEAVRCLSDVGVDVFALIDLADYIFEDESSNDSEEEIELDFGRFMEVVLQLRGSNQATVKDIVDLRKFMRIQMLENLKQTSKILETLDRGAKLSERLARTTENLLKERLAAVKDQHASNETTEGALSEAEELANLFDAYKVEVGFAPTLPRSTPSGDLVHWIPIPASNATNGRPSEALSEEIAVRSSWTSLDAEAYPSSNPVKTECTAELLGTADILPAIRHMHSPRPGDAMKEDVELSPEEECQDIQLGAQILGGIPRIKIASDERCDDAELEVFRLHVDSMCKQLAIGMNDAIALASKTAERRLAAKHGSSHCVL